MVNQVNKKISLKIANPKLSEEWHPTKNDDLTPNDITTGSNKKVWWVCKEGHEWEAFIANRTKGQGCPFCSGRRAHANNCLHTLNVDLSKQWHPIKNGNLTSKDVTLNSSKKVWWICEYNHEWQASVTSRNRGSGCPYCAGQLVCIDNSLYTSNPELIRQWHPVRNGELTPSDVTAGSGKKAWWVCEKGHEWEAIISNRAKKGRGCPFCTNQYIGHDNSLQVLNIELSNQWHPTKNGNLTPADVAPAANKKVWWLCGKEHEWQDTIAHRASGRGCPYCSGKRVCYDNCLQTLYPEISKQWHFNKNKNTTPNDVTANSNKKVWWRCEKGHEWKAVIASRTNGRGCPDCSKESQTSFPEQAIYFYVNTVFNDTINRHRHNDKWEIDIFVPCLNFGIEYDGIYYHGEGKTSDVIKEEHITSAGIRILRVKEHEDSSEACYLRGNVIYCSKRLLKQQLDEVIQKCFEYIGKNITHSTYDINVNVKRDTTKIHNLYIKTEKEGSLLAKFPELSKQWHPTKNLNIKPDMIKPSSNKKFWWLCDKGHEWEAVIGSRAKGKNCPYCSGRFVLPENCLETLNPELSKQWHPTKNGTFTPRNVKTGTHKKVWWLCEKGHEWKATIFSRTSGVGCPYCMNKSVNAENCLQTTKPLLASQWHPNKNGKLTPYDVSSGSGKKVWWLCEKKHEWEAPIAARSNGRGCPYCSGRRASNENCLQTVNPELSSQWFYGKNGSLTPEDVGSHSNKKVWWRCEKGHEWEAVIASRTNGKGCPYCSGRFAHEGNSLQSLYPTLSAQWHKTKNGSLTPDRVTVGSKKKAWWVCDNGHEWEATVYNRAKLGRGCPYCSEKLPDKTFEARYNLFEEVSK